MQTVITIVIGCTLLVWSLRSRLVRNPRPTLDLAYFLQALLASFAIGISVAKILLPCFWLAFSLMIRSGKIEDNFLPGSSIDDLLISAVLGAVATLGFSIFGYLKHLHGDEGDTSSAS